MRALDTVGGVRTFTMAERLDASALDEIVVAKRGRTVSVCIPCRDEAATIGPLVSVIRRELMGSGGLVDELIVLDDRSTDDTARVASHAGARVVSIDDVHRTHGEGHGKGNALWATLLVSHGDPAAITEAFRQRLSAGGVWAPLAASVEGRVHALPASLFSINPGLGMTEAADALSRMIDTSTAPQVAAGPAE